MDMELKRMSKNELINKVSALNKEIEELKEKLESAETRLNSREIELQEAGSIAEASLKLNGVFEAVQSAAEQYLENIKNLSGQQDRICEQREKESVEKAVRLMEETADKCSRLEKETKEKCEKMVLLAKQESETYWELLSKKMENFYNEHIGLKELINFSLPGSDEENK
ncbi:MAG: hypothetical protein IJC41_05040 [Firmicutes bacterium]|nr:hypothetical protein [Clostridiales bacterium]MBQ4340344.1 hypothetical protein [Bacillota bacterium]